jgi:protein-L-isoaspartate(D-aspartate) O-methyltransferase
MDDGSDFANERKHMVETQIMRRGLLDPRLLAAFEAVPRHLFVPESERYLAYGDGPLPIGAGQTISQPYIVALMTHLLELAGDERVLEVGTGSGYQSAILSHLAREVHTIEFVPELAERARKLLAEYPNVYPHVGDGSLGWPEAAPYDGIIVTAAAPRAPQALLDQLNDGSHLVIPIGGHGYQELEVWTRCMDEFDRRSEINVAFVPLRGKEGW